MRTQRNPVIDGVDVEKEILLRHVSHVEEIDGLVQIVGEWPVVFVGYPFLSPDGTEVGTIYAIPGDTPDPTKKQKQDDSLQPTAEFEPVEIPLRFVRKDLPTHCSVFVRG